MGVAREQARKDLPLSTYTEAYWKIDLHNLLHFLKLRMDAHAQLEIRNYANAIGDIVKVWCPLVWEAFCDYQLNSITLSRVESLFIYHVQRKDFAAAHYLAVSLGWLVQSDTSRKMWSEKNREFDEFHDKLIRLQLSTSIPWSNIVAPEEIERPHTPQESDV